MTRKTLAIFKKLCYTSLLHYTIYIFRFDWGIQITRKVSNANNMRK